MHNDQSLLIIIVQQSIQSELAYFDQTCGEILEQVQAAVPGNFIRNLDPSSLKRAERNLCDWQTLVLVLADGPELFYRTELRTVR